MKRIGTLRLQLYRNAHFFTIKHPYMSPLYRKARLLSLCLGIAMSSRAQQAPAPDHCATARVMQDHYRQHPAAKKAAAQLESFTRNFIAARKNIHAKDAQDVQYTIPVVFHVNDPVNPHKVTMAQIQSAIDILNEDYNARNADLQQLDPRFAGIAANIHITFRLADIDPKGNPTSGVTYHYNDLDGRSPDGSGRAVKSISWWPGEKYLNIWVVSEVEQKGVFNNSGWSYLPDDWVLGEHLDGIVYNWRYLGRSGVGSSEAGSPHMKRVLSHEVGHFLNLHHTFQNECNAPGDEVDDTPPTKSNYGGCNVTANSCGMIANVENYMDYSSCGRMFTIGQRDRMIAAMNSNVAQRRNLWSPANLAATLLMTPTKRLLFSDIAFAEKDSNDGSIFTVSTIKAVDGARFAQSSGTFTSGTHFTVQGLPAGLSTSITLLNDTTARLTFTGKALQHGSSVNTDSVRLTFLNAAIAGGAAGLYRSYALLGFHFINPYRIVYKDEDDVTINSAHTWDYFEFGIGDAAFGGWHDNGKLRLETYQKAAVCEGTTRNITPLAAGTMIDSTSNFVAGGLYPDEHDIYSNAYTKWAGKSGYIGVRFNLNGKPRYGWVRITVAANGSSFTIQDFAYNETPGAGIRAGGVDGVTLSWSQSTFKESGNNDGTLRDTANISILGGSFSRSSGNYISGQHYTVSNVPAGLFLQLTAVNSTNARLTFSGKANAHAAANNSSITITWLPAAFSGTAPAVKNRDINIVFRDPYQIKYVDVDDTQYTVNAANPWYFFRVDNIGTADYGLWLDNGALRLETYTKPIVCNGTSLNISLLAPNTMVNNTSGFVNGGEYPNEHNLVTPSYTTWKGKTGFAGFSFVDQGEKYYGWFRFKVNTDGSSYTLMDYAYNTRPATGILTGQGGTSGGIDTTANAGDYCAASTALNYNTITSVKFSNLQQPSGWDGYKDFTSATANVTAGQSYELEVKLNVEYWPDIAVAVWADWNGDKTFSSAERIYWKRGSGPFKQNITVPANAVSGATLLRVRMGYGSDLAACGVDNYQGEVEDYTVRISNAANSSTAQKPTVTGTLQAVNPFGDNIQAWYTAERAGRAIVTLTNIRGQVVAVQVQSLVKGVNSIQLRPSQTVLPGMYILEVQDGNKRSRLKLMK